MQKSESEFEKLQALQREAAELRAQRKQASQQARAQDDRKKPATELPEAVDRLLDDAIETRDQLEHDASQAIHKLASRIEIALEELEDVTRKRPTVALLAAITVGIVIGQLFSRR